MSKAFAIFAKYSGNYLEDIAAEEDVLYSGPNPDIVSKEDIETLEKLGWKPLDKLACFRKYL